MYTYFKNIKKEYKHKFKFNVYKDYEFTGSVSNGQDINNDIADIQLINVNFLAYNIPSNINKKTVYYINILKDCIYGSDFLNKIFPVEGQTVITKVTYIGIYKKNYAYGIKSNSVEIKYTYIKDEELTAINLYDEVSVVDNRWGVIYSINELDEKTYMGIIDYKFGHIILNKNDASYSINIKFKNTYEIYTYKYLCKIRDNEFNTSTNQTKKDLIPTDDLYSKIYITSIGLYNDNYELLAIAKLSKPLLKPTDYDLGVIIKYDL